jgi:hypothetical protein
MFGSLAVSINATKNASGFLMFCKHERHAARHNTTSVYKKGDAQELDEGGSS